MKEIVITIPEDMYRAIKDDTYCGVLHLTLYDAIKNGIELPKGHGRLIDADAVINQEYGCYWETETELNLAPTLVEADKGEEK